MDNGEEKGETAILAFTFQAKLHTCRVAPLEIQTQGRTCGFNIRSLHEVQAIVALCVTKSQVITLILL